MTHFSILRIICVLLINKITTSSATTHRLIPNKIGKVNPLIFTSSIPHLSLEAHLYLESHGAHLFSSIYKEYEEEKVVYPLHSASRCIETKQLKSSSQCGRRLIPQWTFDPQLGRCSWLWYGGCEGRQFLYSNQRRCDLACPAIKAVEYWMAVPKDSIMRNLTHFCQDPYFARKFILGKTFIMHDNGDLLSVAEYLSENVRDGHDTFRYLKEGFVERTPTLMIRLFITDDVPETNEIAEDMKMAERKIKILILASKSKAESKPRVSSTTAAVLTATSSHSIQLDNSVPDISTIQVSMYSQKDNPGDGDDSQEGSGQEQIVRSARDKKEEIDNVTRADERMEEQDGNWDLEGGDQDNRIQIFETSTSQNLDNDYFEVYDQSQNLNDTQDEGQGEAVGLTRSPVHADLEDSDGQAPSKRDSQGEEGHLDDAPSHIVNVKEEIVAGSNSVEMVNISVQEVEIVRVLNTSHEKRDEEESTAKPWPEMTTAMPNHQIIEDDFEINTDLTHDSDEEEEWISCQTQIEDRTGEILFPLLEKKFARQIYNSLSLNHLLFLSPGMEQSFNQTKASKNTIFMPEEISISTLQQNDLRYALLCSSVQGIYEFEYILGGTPEIVTSLCGKRYEIALRDCNLHLTDLEGKRKTTLEIVSDDPFVIGDTVIWIYRGNKLLGMLDEDICNYQ